jgi:uncharacterized membrane protein YgaE (UPF0421/DUF939 family)
MSSHRRRCRIWRKSVRRLGRSNQWSPLPAPSRQHHLHEAVALLLGFIVGALIGVIVTVAFTWFAWKIPMDNALKEVQAREQQLRMSQDREKKLRDALQEAQDAINRALGSLGTSTTTESASPTTAPTPSPPSR